MIIKERINLLELLVYTLAYCVGKLKSLLIRSKKGDGQNAICLSVLYFVINQISRECKVFSYSANEQIVGCSCEWIETEMFGEKEVRDPHDFISCFGAAARHVYSVPSVFQLLESGLTYYHQIEKHPAHIMMMMTMIALC